MHCKRYLLASVSVLAMLGLTALTVRAADLPARTPYVKAPPYAPAFSWTGLYVGLHAGGGWLDHKQSTFENNGACQPLTALNVTNTCEFDPSGAVLGGFAGYNWQSGNIVLGVEADGSWTNLKRTQAYSNFIVPAGLTTVRGEVEWLATIRGRLGVAFGRTLLYGTGGVAFGGVNSGWGGGINGPSSCICDVVDNKTKTGWVAGGGIEHAFAGNWSLRAEVLYHDLGKDTGSITAIGTTYSTTFKHAVTAARAGLALRW